MRLHPLVCIAVVFCAGYVRAQNRRNNNNNNNNNNNGGTRIGLVSDQLGVNPVPVGGGNIVGPRPIQGCFCLPINQQCPITNVRIANRPVAGGCPGQKLCCPDGNFPVNPVTPPTGPVTPRPPPVVPAPTQLGRCGVQNPIPYRTANFAEADFGEYPWTSLVLTNDNGYLGGGALIDNQFVVTAAHKIFDLRNNPFNMKVRLGDLDVSSVQDHPRYPHIEVGVAQIYIHPQFEKDTLKNDVAVLRLASFVNTQQYPNIGLVCLPDQGDIFSGNNQCWVTGWGQDAFEGGQFQQILKEVDVPVVDHFVCQERLRNTRLTHDFNLDQRSFVCAGGVVGKDACTGDGGAPLVCRTNKGFTLVGLVAWGIGCGQDNVPGVYVNIPSYVRFIQGVIRSAQG